MPRPIVRRAAYHRRGIEPQWKGPGYWGLTNDDINWAHEQWLSGMTTLQRAVQGLHRYREGKRDTLTTRKLKLEFQGLGLLTTLNRGERRRLREVAPLRRLLADKYDLIAADLLWGILKICELEEIDIRAFVERIGVMPGERGLRSLQDIRHTLDGIQHSEGLRANVKEK